jgi:hypothetical protein
MNKKDRQIIANELVKVAKNLMARGLTKRHEKLLDKWAESSEGQRHLSRGVVFYDDLPRNLIN